MAKILLVYPPISKQERYASDIGDSGGKQVPLGIYYLAAYMRKNGFDVSAIDAETEELGSTDIVKRIRDFEPDFIGISSTTVAFHRALEVASEIKKQIPAAVTILGGPHISSNYSHAMSFPVFDYGVFGEGEVTLLELCKTLIGGNSVENISGIVFRNSSQELVKNPPRQMIADLDELPFPAYDLIPDIDKYKQPPNAYKKTPVRSIITSRGCPWQCTFCDKSIFGNKYRKRSAQNIFDEIVFLKKNYGLEEIAFHDDTFLIDKQRVYELFGLLDRAGLSFAWTCLAKISEMDEELIKFIKENGCWRVSFGLESGDEVILKIIKKNISKEAVRKVLGLCKKHGLETAGFFIVGHPMETVETINTTMKFALSLPLDALVVTINTPIPGSVQYAEASKYGKLDETDWSKYSYWRPVFIPKGLTEEILLKKHKEFYRRFYLRPRIMFNIVKSFFGREGMHKLRTVIKSGLFLFRKSS